MSGTEARTTEGGPTGNTEIRDEADSAAERLGGPLEDEQTRDTTGEAEADVGRRADITAGEGEQRPDAASDAETEVDRRADTPAGEGEQSSDTASEAQTDADRQTDTDAGQRTTLIEPERAESYNSRWNELKSEFVDDPRRAVRGANELVGEVLDELEELFRSQRADLEHGLDSEQTSTEDLRQALGRYRSFFDRLLSF
jgi:hypothetical protein